MKQTENLIELLEARIAPAVIAGAPNGEFLLKAGDILGTAGEGAGAYLLKVEKGQALVYTQDFNNDGVLNFNEITGISAGDGLRLVSFVDINGDIVTNLQADGKRTDSDGSIAGEDGLILLNSSIEKIQFIELGAFDSTLAARSPGQTTFNLENIVVGKSFGTTATGDGLSFAGSGNFKNITTGTASSERPVTFGSFSGTLDSFAPSSGQVGGDINGVSATLTYTFESLRAGDGSVGSRGGSISNIVINGDTGSYAIVAGNGGTGPNGGAGGNLSNISQSGDTDADGLLVTGDGGRGLSGNGGNGGTATLGTFRSLGTLTIEMGDGGDGFLKGGDGASLTTFVNDVPEPTGVTVVTNVVSTTRDDGEIGRNTPLDLDGDGFGDIVYTTSSPDRLSVAFYDDVPGGSYTIIGLDTSGGNLSVTTGDYDGDGDTDIAVASADPGSNGISVFLNNGDRTFNSALTTPWALLIGDTATSGIEGRQLVSGDFNADGNLDIAYQRTYQVGANDTRSVLIVQEGDGTGVFSVAGNDVYVDISVVPTSNWLVQATALSTGDLRDVLVVADPASKNVSVYEYDPLISGSTQLSTVDITTNAPNTTVIDFTIGDYDNDGDSDIAVLTSFFVDQANPVLAATPVVIVEGDGLGGFVGTSGVPFALVPANVDIQRIVTTDTDNDGFRDDLALLNFIGSATNPDFVIEVELTSLTSSTQSNVAISYSQTALVPTGGSPLAFDAYARRISAAPDELSYAIGFPTDPPVIGIFGDNVPANNLIDITGRNPLIIAGNGGNSINGVGGNGGNIGNGTLTITSGVVTDASIQILLPNNDAGYAADYIFRAGNGGNGNTVGGRGGSISGIFSDNPAPVLVSIFRMAGGDGGDALNGRAGQGGAVTKFVMDRLLGIAAGDGGNGLFGGAGGAVTGNNGALSDTKDLRLAVSAGDGGNGLLGGGIGGSVSALRSEFLTPLNPTFVGSMSVFGGNGGSSVAGTGGLGGSVSSTSPFDLNNQFKGMFYLRAGNGGDGLTGGAGGTVRTFINSPDPSLLPVGFAIFAGNGGEGVTGNGGAGGLVQDVSVTASVGGPAREFDEASISVGVSQNYANNIIVAGNGGVSFGATGGAGGNLTSFKSVASTGTSLVLVTGLGGDGLLAGGIGGTASTLNINVSPAHKALLISGKGGDAYGFVAQSTSAQDQMLAYGGKNGLGGRGGNISGITQQGAVNVTVDLISGDGGSTINYGKPSDTKSGVGAGGSISGITLAGSLGNASSAVAIESYEDEGLGETITDFVNNVILGTPAVLIDNALGNVGVVVGKAGSVAGGLPAGGGINGSLTTINVGNLTSAVAGSVDRIAAIQSISGIKSSGLLGSDKIPLGNTPDYLDAASNPVNNVALGGSLIDGAIVGKVITGISGQRVFVR
jgi:hypothetical protein